MFKGQFLFWFISVRHECPADVKVKFVLPLYFNQDSLRLVSLIRLISSNRFCRYVFDILNIFYEPVFQHNHRLQIKIKGQANLVAKPYLPTLTFGVRRFMFRGEGVMGCTATTRGVQRCFLSLSCKRLENRYQIKMLKQYL